MLVVTNLEGGEFSRELGHIIVTVQAVQNTLLDNIVNVANEQGYNDVHFDFEFCRRMIVKLITSSFARQNSA